MICSIFRVKANYFGITMVLYLQPIFQMLEKFVITVTIMTIGTGVPGGVVNNSTNGIRINIFFSVCLFMIRYSVLESVHCTVVQNRTDRM